jgi:hypothetical protein
MPPWVWLGMHALSLDWPDTGAILPKLELFEDESLLNKVTASIPGIYLLFDGDELVYVGQSGDIKVRLAQHRKEGAKQFDRVLLYHMASEMSRLRTEGILILYFLPKYNRGINLGMNRDRLWAIRWKRSRD